MTRWRHLVQSKRFTWEVLLAGLIATSSVPAAPSDNTPTPACCSYVHVEKGHLVVEGQRLRLWGVNIQSGVFRTQPEIDGVVLRMHRLGFNGLRLWPTVGTFHGLHNGPSKHRNVDSVLTLDLFDRLVYRAGQHGMRIQMTMLHYLDLPTIRAIYASEFGDAKAARLEDSQLRTVHGILPYLSPTYLAALKAHIIATLQRTNPYTGRPYHSEPAISAWELANESRFVECLTNSTCRSRLPAEVGEQVEAAWQAWLRQDRAENTSAVGPLPPMAEAAPGIVTRFVVTTFAKVSAELESTARHAGGPGSGVAVQAFIYNTGPAVPHLAAHYANSLGNATAVGLYSSPLNKAADNGSPWTPWSVSNTVPAYFSYLRVHGKPLVVYETSFFRPYDHRAEFGPVIAAIALEQDWDAVYLYQYGQPAVLYGSGGAGAGYGRFPLPNPDSASTDPGRASYTRGFHHGADPTTMASWSLAGRLFVAARSSPTMATTFQISVSSIYEQSPGYPRGVLDAAHSASRHSATSFQFTALGESRRLVSAPRANPADFATKWSAANGSLRLSTPAGSLLAGWTPSEPVALTGGLTVTVDRPGFRVVGTASDALGDHLHVIADTRNRGYRFDQERVDHGKPYGAQHGITAQGTAPIEYEPISVQVRLETPRARADESFDFKAGPLQAPATAYSQGFNAEQFRTRLLPGQR